MNKNNSFIIQFICLGVVFLAILTQSFTQWIKMKPLSGFTKEIEAKELSFKTYYDGFADINKCITFAAKFDIKTAKNRIK